MFSFRQHTVKTLFLLIGIMVSGCATTKPAVIEVRPVPLIEQTSLDLQEDIQRAKQFYEAGKNGLAYSEYKNLLMMVPKDTEISLAFADAALAMGNIGTKYNEEAELVYTRLVDNEGASKKVLKQAKTGLVLLGSMKSGGNVEGLKELSVNSDDPRVWNALGRGYDKKGEWISALDAYLKALNLSYEIGRAVAPVQNNMGMSLLLQGRTREAVVKFEQAHDSSPDIQLYDNNYRLGLIFAGDLTRALEGVEEGQAAQLLNDAGYIAAGIGAKEQARTLYQEAIRLSPVYFQIAENNLKSLG